MKEYHKKWYEENKERLKVRMKENRAQNLDRDKKRSRDWYWDNRELSIERVKRNSAIPENKLKKRGQTLKYNYGISLDDYEEMFISQNGRCAICEIHQDDLSYRLHVDHNHTTGKVRKLLCSKCNMAIGLLDENPKLIARALEYIQNEQ